MSEPIFLKIGPKVHAKEIRTNASLHMGKNFREFSCLDSLLMKSLFASLASDDLPTNSDVDSPIAEVSLDPLNNSSKLIGSNFYSGSPVRMSSVLTE